MRFVRLRYWPLWLACALLLALAVWVRPRRIDGLATLDGQHRWWVDNSSPPRQFAWQPGEELSGLLPQRDPPDEITQPCLADDGCTLYITVRRAGGDADIYRSQWFDGRWQPAVAVTELNTPWDEVGVAVGSDGRQLYLASDRRGGKGGYDLYVARHRALGWGVPRNLGETVNTAADEVEPAIAADGSQLYFSSNRANEQSDLYVAQHGGKDGGWANAEPVARANTGADERSPCLGDGGTVLYFASDRPARGRAGNFDLYRMLLRDPAAPVESLGQGVNTPADETSPAISADGFGLTFVRQTAGAPPGVYQSRLAEVKTISVWDNSRWLALRAVWWKALLATVLFGGLVAAVYYSGGWLRRRASMARFLAASALVHAILLWLMVAVPLSQEIVRRVEEIRVSKAATDMFDDNLHQSHETGEQAYEKVADLQSVEAVETPPVARQVTAPTNVPLHSEDLAPTLPPALARRLPADRVIFIPPASTQPKVAGELERRPEAAMHVASIGPVTAEPPAKVASPEEPPLEENVETERMAASSVELQEAPAAERPLAEMVVQPSALEPVAERATRLASAATLPMSQPATQAPPPAMVDPETIALAAIARTDEQTALAAESPEVTIGVNNLVAPLTSLDESRPPAMPPTPIVARIVEPPRVLASSQPPKVEMRRSAVDSKALAASSEEPLMLTKVEAPPEALVAPARVELASAASSLPLPVDDTANSGGPRQLDKRELVVGTLAKKAVEAPPSLSPLASQLQRPTARATPVAFAEDNVGLQAMFVLRQGDTRREFIDLAGGNEQTEAAVRRGLAWLAEHQHADGHWSLHQLDPPEKKLPATSGAAGTVSDAAGTGLGLLPFLGSGHTHLAGDHQAIVGKAIAWLVEHQKPDGNLFTEGPGNAVMYSHGIASIALCEAYGMSHDERLREPAQRALNFIVSAQNKDVGGWRYQPGEPGDTSVVGWQVMALKSGEMAGLDVPKATLDLASKWLTNASGTGGSLGRFGYQGPGDSPAMTAEGLLCRQFLGARRNDPAVLAAVNFLSEHLPQAGQESSYYWYYATQVMYHMQGHYWTAWNERLRDLLVSSQIKDGHQSGTWDVHDGWEQAGGRLYATSLRLLMLEVYYRHLPLYQQWE